MAISCPAAGACTAASTYLDPAGHDQAFEAAERGGVWGPATPIPGAAALNAGPDGQVNALSCTSAGNCSVAGTYGADSSGSQTQLYVDTEKNGGWGTAVAMPGLAALNTGLSPRRTRWPAPRPGTARPVVTTRTAPAASRRS